MKGFISALKVLAWVAAAASAGAAWFGLYMTYAERTAPFKPTISFGTPVLKPVGEIVSVAFPLTFSNAGAQPGCIADIALRIQSKTAGTRWTLFPTFFLDVAAYLRGMPAKEEPLKAVEGPSTPIRLSGREAISKGVLFMPRPTRQPRGLPLRINDLLPGDSYDVEVFSIGTGPDCAVTAASSYVGLAKASFVLEAPQIDDLRQNRAVLPLDAVRDSLRESFLVSP